jgi:hypothetical protein
MDHHAVKHSVTDTPAFVVLNHQIGRRDSHEEQREQREKRRRFHRDTNRDTNRDGRRTSIGAPIFQPASITSKSCEY